MAYVGMFGQAVGVQREFSGTMSKPWRMVALSIGSLVTLTLLWWIDELATYRDLTVRDWTLIVILAGCDHTIAVRLRRILRSIAARDES